MKKLIVLLLAAVMLITAVACGDKKGTDDPKNTNKDKDPGGESTEYVHTLPDKDYDGREYRVSAHEQYVAWEIFVPEESSDPLANAVWVRNQNVEDRYDCTITPILTGAPQPLTGHVQEALGLILADQDAFDIVNTYVVVVGTLVTSNVLLDWSQFKNTYLEGSWWTQSINEEFMIDGHLYTPVGAMNISSLMYTMPILMNANLAKTKQVYDEVIETIQNDDWTIDYFNNLVAELSYDDVDDISGASDGDVFGFQAEALTNLDMYQFAFDIPMVVQDEDTTLRFAWGQGEYREKLSTAVDKVLGLYWENNGSLCHMDNAGAHQNNFKADKAVFITARIRDIFAGIKDMESTYTVLPFPKFNDDQEDYYCGMGDNYTQMCMPVTAVDTEFISIITEALNMESEKHIWPAFYEDALRTKYQDDPVSHEMIDRLLAGRKADLGVVFNTDLGGVSMMFRRVVRSKENTMLTDIDGYIESYNERVEKVVQAYYDSAKN